MSHDTAPESPWLSTGQVARHFDVHPVTVRRWAATGVLRAIKLGKRTLRFQRAEIEWKSCMEVKPATEEKHAVD